MRFPWAALVLATASCASRREPAQRERDPIEVWIPAATPEKDREEIAKALVGHPPPRHDRIPAHHCVRWVNVAASSETSWEFYIHLAMKHARDLDADAIVVLAGDTEPQGMDPCCGAYLEIVRYDRAAATDTREPDR